MSEQKQTQDQPQVTNFGYLAEYKDPTHLVAACKKVRDAGYSKWDAYSPFPIHGIDPAMGIKPTVLPWLIFGAGGTGTVLALLMQWWMNAIDYPFVISGKPFWSLPANIPVAFEITVLFAAVTAFFGVLIFSGLPQLFHPLFNNKRFHKVTDDGFFLAIEAVDQKFDAAQTKALLEGTGALAIEEVVDNSRVNGRLPRPIVYAFVVATVATLVPLALIAKARTSTMETPRLHVFPHMDFQEKVKTQTVAPMLPNGRAMQAPVEGTVAMGAAEEDDHYHRGVQGGQWADEFPAQVSIDERTLARGQERYNIYCSTCHGEAGYGDGVIHRRMEKLEQPTWVQPSNLHADNIRSQPVGHLFNTVTWGIRNMNGYGHAIAVEDRWAIVAYLKALQRSQYANLEDVPVAKRGELR